MEPLTMAILGGTALGGLSYFNDKDANKNREETNFATRQAITRNAPLVKYDMPDEYVAPTLIQKLLTGGATGLEMGTQFGLAKKLLGSGENNTYNGKAFQSVGEGGPEREGYSKGPGDELTAVADLFNKQEADFSSARAPSAWDTFLDSAANPEDQERAIRMQRSVPSQNGYLSEYEYPPGGYNSNQNPMDELINPQSQYSRIGR